MGGESAGKEMPWSCWPMQERFLQIGSVCRSGEWGRQVTGAAHPRQVRGCSARSVVCSGGQGLSPAGGLIAWTGAPRDAG